MPHDVRGALGGFVAVYAHERASDVTDPEIDGLVATYLDVRPGGAVRQAPEHPRLRAAVVDLPVSPGPGLEPDGASWAAFVGSIATAAPLSTVPLADLDGHFALLRFDAAAGTAEVATDPLGLQSVFVATVADRTYVSTSALTLARHLGRGPDLLGVTTFLRAGYLFGALTHWDGVRRLEPGTVVRMRPSGLSTDVYWRFELEREVARLPLDRAVEHGLDVLRSTCRSYLGTEEWTWVDLSGGFDSRLLALAIDAAGVPFRSTTRGEPGGDEPRVAAEVARLRGWDWTLYSYPDDPSHDMAPLWGQTLAWSDAYQPAGELAQRMWKHVRTAHIRPSLVGGGAGEVFRNSASQQEFARAGTTTRVNLDNAITMRWLHPLDVAAFRDDPTAAVRSDFARKLTEWTVPYRGELNSLQLDLMYAYKSTGTLGTQASTERSVHMRHWPFLFRPVFVAALSTSPRHRIGHRLQRRMIERLDPRVADVRTSPWGGPAAPMRLRNVHRFAPYYYDIGRRASLKLLQKATRSGIGRPPARTRQLTMNRVLLEHADAVTGETLRADTMRSASLFRPRELDRLLADARAARSGNADLIDRVLTLELALHAVGTDLEQR